MTVFLSDCAFCKNFRGFEKRPFGGLKKTFCLAYPKGIPISIENENKVEGQICNKNNGIGYEEKNNIVKFLKDKNMKKDIGINEKDSAEFFNKMVYSNIPTEEQMEKALLYHKENSSLRDIHIWIFDCISYWGELGIKWKNFFLKHGMINEKEEIIYKQ